MDWLLTDSGAAGSLLCCALEAVQHLRQASGSPVDSNFSTANSRIAAAIAERDTRYGCALQSASRRMSSPGSVRVSGMAIQKSKRTMSELYHKIDPSPAASLIFFGFSTKSSAGGSNGGLRGHNGEMDTPGQRIAYLVDRSGRSQGAFAEAIGLGEDSVSKWINGKAKPRRSNLQRIAEVFGRDVSEIVDFVVRGAMPEKPFVPSPPPPQAAQPAANRDSARSPLAPPLGISDSEEMSEDEYRKRIGYYADLALRRLERIEELEAELARRDGDTPQSGQSGATR